MLVLPRTHRPHHLSLSVTGKTHTHCWLLCPAIRTSVGWPTQWLTSLEARCLFWSVCLRTPNTYCWFPTSGVFVYYSTAFFPMYFLHEVLRRSLGKRWIELKFHWQTLKELYSQNVKGAESSLPLLPSNTWILMTEQIEFLLTNIQSFSIFANYSVIFFMILSPLFPFLFRNLIE